MRLLSCVLFWNLSWSKPGDVPANIYFKDGTKHKSLPGTCWESDQVSASLKKWCSELNQIPQIACDWHEGLAPPRWPNMYQRHNINQEIRNQRNQPLANSSFQKRRGINKIKSIRRGHYSLFAAHIPRILWEQSLKYFWGVLKNTQVCCCCNFGVWFPWEQKDHMYRMLKFGVLWWKPAHPKKLLWKQERPLKYTSL